MVAVGACPIWIVAVVANAEQPPVAPIVYVTVYVAAVLPAKPIAPVFGLMDRPDGTALYVPPVLPVRVTVAVPPEVQ
ncbi:MAG TPA: hypothetical protein PL109_09605 [Nitrospira sp.]|jgi:hypothetical protein|nr:hypothetical protein [Nitrospira sp.]